jgi:type II secretory ATPase GspE/PulE/Tfp pilus assembly ATPase PilB-like protein
MESLCSSCQRPVDPFEFLPPAARHQRPPAGSYAVSEGCPSCRGSGLLLWQPVYEFLSCLPPEDPFHPRRPARELRDDRATRGLNTLSLAGFARAASGMVDVREPLRLLLHEG